MKVLLLIASWILFCEGGELSIFFHHSFNPVVNVEFDFIAVIVADLEAISMLKTDCKLYNVVLEIKNIQNLDLNSFIKPLCDYTDELNSPIPNFQSSPYINDVLLLNETDLYTIDINIQRLIFPLEVSAYHILIKLENSASSHKIIARSEINKPSFDSSFFYNKDGNKNISLLFHPSFQPMMDVYSDVRVILVASLEIFQELKVHCKFINVHLHIEAPFVVYKINPKSLCNVEDEFDNVQPLSPSPLAKQLSFSEQRIENTYFMDFFIGYLTSNEETGYIFSWKLETLDGQVLVESEKKVYYTFKAIDETTNNEPNLAMPFDSSLFPQNFQYTGRVLITGGCSFLGRHFVNRFCELGYLVFVIDNLGDPDSLLPNDWPNRKCKESQLVFRQENYLNYLENDDTFSSGTHQLNVFVHLASGDNDFYLDSAAIQFAVKSKPDHFIFFSDASLALKKSDLGADDFNINVFDSNFASLWSKENAERLAKVLFKQHKTKVSIYRISNVYGEEQLMMAIPSLFISILNQIMEKRNNPINSQSVFIEKDISKDFIYVNDAVNCVLNTFSLVKSDPINLLTGVSTSLSALAKLMAKQAGYKKNLEIYILQNQNLKNKISSVISDTFIGDIDCQLSTTIDQGIDILMKKYLEMEEKKKGKSDYHAKDNSDRRNINLYSSYKCLGGSQLFSDFNEQDSIDKFPSAGDPSFRVCHFKNVCLSGGKMQYFKDPQLNKLPLEYLIDSFQKNTSNFFRTNYYSPAESLKFNFEIELASYTLFSSMVKNQTVFVDERTFAYNVAHLLHDNIIPHFAASRLLNLSLVNGQIIYTNPCTHMPEVIKNKSCIDDPNKSYTQRCLDNTIAWSNFFFSKPPLFLSEMEESQCYSDLVIGQGSTFSIFALDLSRSVYIADLTQHILNGYPILNNLKRSRESLNILVAQAGKNKESDFTVDLTICERIKFCVDSTPFAYENLFFSLPPVVNCIVPENLSLLEQVISARQAHIIVSYDGTLAHISMFAQSNTQQIIIKKSNVRDLKFALDNHVFLWTNHLHPLYVKQSVYYKEICSILLLSFKNYVSFNNNN